MIDKQYHNHSIDLLNISAKTKNNLKYLGILTLVDLIKANINENPKFYMFSNSLRKKILLSLKEIEEKQGNC